MTTIRPQPEVTEVSAPYWASLAGGTLSFQRCTSCDNAWLPARQQCPRCLGNSWRWEEASGKATLVSWVVYHTAYHPYFADRLPYSVGVIELQEGPRLIAGITNPSERLVIHAPVTLTVLHEGDLHIPTFTTTTTGVGTGVR